MVQRVKMSMDEKILMYNAIEKDKLIEMLIEANRCLDSIVYGNETSEPTMTITTNTTVIERHIEPEKIYLDKNGNIIK